MSKRLVLNLRVYRAAYELIERHYKYENYWTCAKTHHARLSNRNYSWDMCSFKNWQAC
jgi:hypothetical protein